MESAELAKILTDPTAILAAILSAKGGLWATCGGMIDQLRSALTRVVTGNQTSMTQSHAALVSGVATSRQLYRTIPQMNPDLVLGLVSQLQAWNLAYIAPAPIREVDHQGIVQNDNIHLQALGTKLVRFVRDRLSAHSGK